MYMCQTENLRKFKGQNSRYTRTAYYFILFNINHVKDIKDEGNVIDVRVNNKTQIGYFSALIQRNSQ